jgi:3-oxoacyl-[acyl-carrier protein] reductase
MNLGISGKVALVTAASQGLGKAAALELANEGALLAICSRSDDSINKAADDIRSATGARVLPVRADVSDQADISRLLETVTAKLGPVQILVNNAGGPPTGDILAIPDEEWLKGYHLTLMSVVRLCRGVLPEMRDAKWGRIITITSIAAKQPINDLLISSTLRPGIHGLTKVLSNKFAGSGITVNTVCPGNILTHRQEELMAARSKAAGLSPAELMNGIVKEIPAGRLGKPGEIGSVVAFLASEQAAYINGVNLLVDGGQSKGIF